MPQVRLRLIFNLSNDLQSDKALSIEPALNIMSGPNENTPPKPQESLGSPAVRFASVDEEIEPKTSLEPLSGIPSIQEPTEHDIRELSANLHNTQLQNRRMSHFAFEPVSLPASRVCALLS